MSFSFASLSVHGFVNSVGAYVGLGSIVAVALLVLLYFAHARETATLRDRLDEAQQRISGLEGRIAQLMQMQSSPRGRGPVAPAPVAPPVAVRPVGAAQGSVRRVPSPATAAAAATVTPPARLASAATQPRPAAAVPSAPAGVAAPALASATKLIPDAATNGAPDDTMFVPPAAANGKGGAEHTAVLTPAQPAAAASARAVSASPRGAVAGPPRVQIAAEPDAADAPATAAAGAGRVRRIGGHPRPPAVSLPAFDDESVSGGGRFSGALLPLIIAGVAVIVIIAGLVVITNSGGGTTSGNVSHDNTAGTTGQALHNKKPAPVHFSAASFSVAVLNGTAQAGLAGDVGKKLVADGYKKGNITNAASQTQGLTFVYYVSSKANKVAAQHIAKALTLPASRVRKAGSGVLQSCTISATGASLGSCSAQVIVSVGQDRVNLATG